MASVLFWESGSSIEKLHEYKVTDNRKAYYANLDKTLLWIMKLFAHLKQDPPLGTLPDQSSLGANTGLPSLNRRLRVHEELGFMLEWCFAMLQPEENHRIDADSLVNQICTVERAVETRFRFDHRNSRRETGPWVGNCCKAQWRSEGRASRPLGLGAVSLLEIWPNSGFWKLLEKSSGYWAWEDVGRTVGYRFPFVDKEKGLAV
jgi:hypothetical protein